MVISCLLSFLSLPAPITFLRTLRQHQTLPGVNEKSAQLLKLKANPKKDADRYVFILLDEMSLIVGILYEQSSGTLWGFTDNGCNRTSKLASSALCVIGVGVLKVFKYPLGYIWIFSIMSAAEIEGVILKAIEELENAGLIVLGITSDQGVNFEKCFRQLGVTPSKPSFSLRQKSYFVMRERERPCILDKNARNFLESGDVKGPGEYGTAKWDHVKQLYNKDCQGSLGIVL